MAFDLNQVILFGRLVRDPELRQTANGQSIARFAVANNPTTEDQNVSFFDIVAFGRNADITRDYLKKGKPVIIIGKLKQRKWEGNDGKMNYRVEVIVDRFHFVDARGDGKQDYQDQSPPISSYDNRQTDTRQQQPPSDQGQRPKPNYSSPKSDIDAYDDFGPPEPDDDNIPF